MSTGAISALLPLRLSAQGASSVIIGAVFLLASGVATVVAPVVGRASDRHGPVGPMSVGLAAGAVLFVLLPVPAAWPLLAALTVIVMGGPLSAFMIPAVPMMTVSAERIGISVVVATTLVNLAYAIGETVGAPGGAILSSAGGDAVPFLVLAGLMLVTLVAVRRHRISSPATAGPDAWRAPHQHRAARPPAGRRGRAAGPGSRPPPAGRGAGPARSPARWAITAAAAPPLSATGRPLGAGSAQAHSCHGTITLRSHRGRAGSLACPRMKLPKPFLLSAVMLLGITASAHAAPVAPSAFTVSPFASAPSHSVSGPDDITSVDGNVYVAWQNGIGPKGQAGPHHNLFSTVVKYSHAGRAVAQWSLPGKVDGIAGDGSALDRHRQRGRQRPRLRRQADGTQGQAGHAVHPLPGPRRQGFGRAADRRRPGQRPDRRQQDPRLGLRTDALGSHRELRGHPGHQAAQADRERQGHDEGQGRQDQRRRAVPDVR